MDKPVEPLAKDELVNQLATLMVEDPDRMMALLCQLVQKAMVMTIMSQVRASLDTHISHMEQELLQASRTEVGTDQGTSATVGGAAQVPW